MKTYGTVIQGKEEEGIQRCPTRRYSFLNSSITFNGAPLPGNGSSYGYNAYGYIGLNSPITANLGLGGGTDGESFKPLAEADVLVPSEMIAMGDNFALLPKAGSHFSTDTVMESLAGLTRQEVSSDRSLDVRERVTKGAKRHNSQGNIVFSDGHVESLTFNDLFLSRDDQSLRRWNRDHQSHR
jgi:prepilin-type processing-associated H-X9-DG protein